MAELETCAVQRVNNHVREVINIGDASKPGLYQTIEFDSYDNLRSCAATESEARAELEKLVAGYCSSKLNRFNTEIMVLDCQYTRAGDVSIERRERPKSFLERARAFVSGIIN